MLYLAEHIPRTVLTRGVYTGLAVKVLQYLLPQYKSHLHAVKLALK
jgi:hypothetical protein